MAAKPVLLTVDDDPDVLRAIERDLRREYGSTYRILRADSASAALEALKQLKLRNETVALILADQRMPQMNGVEMLEQAIELFPNAKKALLTAYADTDAAIKAINSVRIDYYFVKPWDPPEERLFPVVNDLLDDWQSGFRPDFEGIRVVGNRWSSLSHQVKDYLARNLVPYLWLDVETDPQAEQLLEIAKADHSHLPLVVFPDGSSLSQPNNLQLAEKVGFKQRAELPFYDLLIVGSGPAGLAAAVYGASEGLRTVLIEREAPGGQAGTSSRIENYLGFPVGLSGADLTRRGVAQAKRFGVELLSPQEASSLRLDGQYKVVKLADGTEINCHALMIATGVSYRKLDVPGVERLTGAGVYYGAAMTEALSCKDDDVYIVGGANSAGQAALYFARYARKVVMLVRADSLAKSMSQYLVDRIYDSPNIEVKTFTAVTEAHGAENLQALTLANVQTGETGTVPATALFIFIGAMPYTEWLSGLVERDEQGFIITGADLTRSGKRPKGWHLPRDPFLLEASVPGIFVAGDVRHGSVKRVASSVGEGSVAVQFIHRYLVELGTYA
jgi:thioredoxin reductase (NADPH)